MTAKTVEPPINVMPLVRLMARVNKPCDRVTWHLLLAQYADALRTGRPFTARDILDVLDGSDQPLQPRRKK